MRNILIVLCILFVSNPGYCQRLHERDDIDSLTINSIVWEDYFGNDQIVITNDSLTFQLTEAFFVGHLKVPSKQKYLDVLYDTLRRYSQKKQEVVGRTIRHDATDPRIYLNTNRGEVNIDMETENFGIPTIIDDVFQTKDSIIRETINRLKFQNPDSLKHYYIHNAHSNSYQYNSFTIKNYLSYSDKLNKYVYVAEIDSILTNDDDLKPNVNSGKIFILLDTLVEENTSLVVFDAESISDDSSEFLVHTVLESSLGYKNVFINPCQGFPCAGSRKIRVVITMMNKIPDEIKEVKRLYKRHLSKAAK